MSEEREEIEKAEEAAPASETESAEAEASKATEAEEKPSVEAAAPAAEANAPAEATAPAVSTTATRTVATLGQPPLRQRVSRRGILRGGFWVGLGATLAGLGAVLLDMVYPRKVTGFGGVVSAGNVADISAGEKIRVTEGRFWLVSLTEEQGGPGLLALWQKCPHLGCTVPWRSDFVFPDPDTGENEKGWFRCPCHGSTFTDAGVRVFGPAPRSMDTMKLSLDENGNVSVDTGDITDGSEENADRAVQT